ncbi:subtilisin-like protease [Mycena belliarum]|uniref:Subtilisin-like protease n=1 Tax=Mycena belliarum TaxID=1033014 RepID=A0AAD6TRS5_9AGAR|nr:subtilisin-like protease [Mycena belliae]
MKAALSLALLGATSVWAAHDLSGVKRVTNVPGLSNKFIVEVAAASDIPSKRALGTPHEVLYRSLRERKIGFSVHQEYDVPDIFVGAAVTLTDAESVADILKTEGVLAIRPIHSYARPVPVSSKQCAPGDAGVPDSESTHLASGVAKLHAMGITGKGVKIGILDTGIDYTHPSLGAGFGAGFKVAGGYDLVGDAYTGANDPVPDSDPLDQCAGHGTHVAGIIGCNPGNPFNISGVAYDATLYAYRIFGCAGSVNDDVIVDALLKGVKDGVDILSLSLGGPSGWTEGTGSVVASRIAKSGRIVTIAAGNEGSSGSWYTSSPGNGLDVISVASADNTVIPLQSLTVEGATHAPIVYYSALPLKVNGTLPLYAVSNDTAVVDDACNPLPASTPDLSKFVVLIRRGTCSFVSKLDNVAKFGAQTFLIYDNGAGFAGIEVGKYKAVMIQAEDGVFLGKQLAAGTAVSVSFPQTGGATEIPAPTGGLVSDFTTYGPTNDFYFKPAITAYGGNILSTIPVPLGSWALESGTSMATPFMAGSAALLFSVKGKSASVGRAARALFESTSMPISTSHTDGGPYQTATQQGTGLVNVYDAVFATTVLSPAELIVNDTAHFAGRQKFNVKNTGRKVKTYTLSHVPAGTALTVTAGSIFPAKGPVPLSTDYASVSFNQNKFTLFPGQTHTVVATIKPPTGADPKTFPVYSGFIYATSGAERVHATYLGLAASLKDKQVVDNTDAMFGVRIPVVLDATGAPQGAAANYTFVGQDSPVLLWRQAFGSAAVRLDLVSANTTLKGSLNARAPLLFSFGHGHDGGGSFAKVPTLGALVSMEYLPRNDEAQSLQNTVAISNTYANGTKIPNGAYKVLLRALKVTGDPKNAADYESWLSPVIGFAA